MNKVFFLIPLIGLGILIPGALAQQAPTQPVITVGQNYDLIEDYQLGVATWSSHPERIFDGSDWKDFIVYDRSSIVQVESNSIGSLVYDKNSCSYSIYENGYVSPGTQIIPAVSWMPRIAEIGTDNYSPMTDLFNQQCSVEVRQGEDWVRITSVKTLTEDLDPVVIVHANGTQSVYPSGTRDIATTTQTLDIRTDNGIKETVSVFNGNPEWNNHKFALSQTIHTGDTITLGEQTYDIAGNSGTVLDRQWIEDNKAQIFQIADSLSYDFDIGFTQLNAIQILNDGTNKVSMDFSVNESTPYLSSYTVDPTISVSANAAENFYSQLSGNSCNTSYHSTNGNGVEVSGGSGNWCLVSYVDYDISTVSSSALIQTATWDYTVSGNSQPDGQLVTLATDPTTNSDSATWTEIWAGSNIGSSFDLTTSGSVDVQSSVQSALSTGKWYAGVKPVTTGNTVSSLSAYTLEITYIIPTQPSAPTNLSAVSGQPIDLSWTASSDLGGAATGDMSYKVERSDYEFAEQPLPVNAGSDSAVNMGTNVLLYHLDATKIDTTTTTYLDEDFDPSPSGWGTTDSSNLQITNNEIQVDYHSSTDDSIAYDLGSALGDSWTLKWKNDVTTYSGNSNYMQYAVGLTSADHTASSITSNQDSLLLVNTVGGSLDRYRIYELDNTKVSGGTGSVTTYSHTSTQETFWAEMTRNGSSLTLKLYSDEYSTLIEEQTHTISGTIEGLQYFKASIYDEGSSMSYGVDIDDILIQSTSTSDPYIEDTSGANNDSENPQVASTTTEDVTWANMVSAQDNGNGEVQTTCPSCSAWENWAESDKTWSASNGFTYTFTEKDFGGGGHGYNDSNVIGIRTASGEPGTNHWTQIYTNTPADTFGFVSENPNQRRIICPSGVVNYDSTGNIGKTHEHKIEVQTDGTVNFYWDGTLLHTCSGGQDNASGDFYAWHFSYTSNGGGTGQVTSSSTSQPTFSTGTIAQQIDEPQITVKSTTLYDGTDSHTVGGWTKVSATSPLIHYDFEQTGSTLDNQISSSYDGTNSGATTGVTGKVGDAWEFNGSSDFVDLGNDSVFDATTSFTVNVWLNTDNITDKRIFGKGSNGAYELLSETTNDILRWRVNDGSVQTLQGTTALSDGQWHMATAVYDKTAGEIRLYVDGSLDGTQTGIGTIAVVSDNLYLGRNQGGNYYDGTMDQFLYFTTALTDSQIAQLYADSSMSSIGQTGTMFSFENTSGEKILYEVEPDKLRVAKEGLSSTTLFSEDGTSTSGWTDSNSILSSSGGELEVSTGSANHKAHKALTQTATGDFTMTFKMTFDSGGDGGGIGVFDTTDSSWSGFPSSYANMISVYFANGGWMYTGAHTGGSWNSASNDLCSSSAPNASGSQQQLSAGDERWVTLEKSATEYVVKVYTDSARSNLVCTDTRTFTDGGSSMANFNEVVLFTKWTSQSHNYDYDDILIQTSSMVKTNIVEATGQTISTTTPSHIQFNRGTSNDWSIYLDGTSVATATDSTSLGTINEPSSTHGQLGGGDTGNIYQSGQAGAGVKLETASATGVGEYLNSFTIQMKVNGGSPSGSVYGYVFSDSNSYASAVATATNTISVSSLTGSHASYTFNFDGTYQLQENDRIVAWYDGGDGSNYLGYSHTTSEAYGSSDWVRTYQHSGANPSSPYWNDDSSKDTALTIATTGVPTYYIGQSPSGTNTLPSLDEFYVFTSDKSGESNDIYQRGSNVFAQVGSTTGSTVTHSDNNSLVSGNTYYHRIVANNGAFDSEPSNVSSSTAGVPPDAPTNLQAAINNPNTAPLDVTLTWTDGAGQGTGTFQNYIVIRSPDNTFSSVTTVGTPTGTTFTDTVPTEGTWYWKVSDQSSHGGSPNSSPANITTPTVPGVPQSLTVTVPDADASPYDVELTWTAPASDGGSAITNYKVFRDGVLVNTVGNVLTATDTAPSNPSTNFVYTVKAVNPVGESATAASYTWTSLAVPPAPASLTITLPDVDTAPFTVQLNFTAPATSDSAVNGYAIHRDSTLIATLGNVLTYDDTTPSNPSTSFVYDVYAISNVGTGTASVQQTWTSPAVPSQVQGLSGSMANSNVNLSWTQPASDSAITNYQVIRDGTNLALAGNQTSYTDSNNIQPDQSINYQVYGMSLVGNGTSSASAIVSTGSAAVLDLTSTNVNENSLVLTWTEPEYSAGNVLGYMINFTTPYGTPDTILVADTGGTTTVQPLSNLAYSANYTFTVGVITNQGVNATGNWHTVQTTADQSITSFNVTSGFDIEAVNTAEIDQIKYTRTENTDGTTTLDVIHPNYYNIECNLQSKFAMTNQNYTNLSTTVVDGNDQKASFVFTGLDNEIITVTCTDTISGDSAMYLLTQNSFPLLEQITNFRSGEYGTLGQFGILDIVTLLVVIISMIGFNRVNPVVGAIFTVAVMGGLAYFKIVELPTVMFGAIAVVVMLIVTNARKK